MCLSKPLLQPPPGLSLLYSYIKRNLLTLEHYQQFKPCQKCHFVRRRGIHLMTIKEYYIAIDLYRLDDFYVELWRHLDERTVMRIRAYQDDYFLEPFLQRINLEELLTVC